MTTKQRPKSAPATAPDTAMVLAAGFGKRMRPITDTMPKPLVPVDGRSMLDRALDKLVAVRVQKAVVNTHYLGDQIEAHLQDRSDIAINLSPEDEILETGGGVQKALPLLGGSPIYVVNSDTVWDDGPIPALQRLAEHWDGHRMDGILLLQPTVTAIGYDGTGDFFLDGVGRLRRRVAGELSPFVFTGVQILHPRLFDGVAAGRFSLNVVYDRALESGRLYGLRHDGAWYHVGTPEGLEQVNGIFSGRVAPVFL